MEKLLSSLDYENPDFYNYNVDNVYPKVNEYFDDTIENSPDRNKQILDSISLLIKLTSTIKIDNNLNELESAHGYLIKEFLNKLDSDDLKLHDVKHIVEIFKQITSFKSQTRTRISVFASLLNLIRGEMILKKFDKQTFSTIVKALMVDFHVDKKYLAVCYDEKSEDDDLEKDFKNESDVYSFQNSIENFFDLNQNDFTLVLTDIQLYYE